MTMLRRAQPCEDVAREQMHGRAKLEPIKVFSSTGEASNADDMRYLISLAGGRPVIEYCGGTEIGGGYITGTVVRPCEAGAFNTLALGLDAVILDPLGSLCENGELFLVPPSIGLSTRLLNKSHHDVYFEGAPPGLRRHGDQMERLRDGFFRAHGRVDDTMNLGGIKVSSAEIERALQGLPELVETAAVAVPGPGGGPSRLIVYAVPSDKSTWDTGKIADLVRRAIRENLNPLFKVDELVLVDALPRTATNKVMRRVLRDRYSSL